MSRQGTHTAESTPALYDTSTSSTTESTSFSSNQYGYFPKSRPQQQQHQQQHSPSSLSAYNLNKKTATTSSSCDPTAASWTSAPLPSKMVSAASRLTAQQRYRPERSGADSYSLERVDETHPRAQSEPGAYSPENDRFAAYIDRLADLEARREQRIKKSKSAEEKKDDQFEKQSSRGLQQQYSYPDPEPTISEIDDDEKDNEHLPAFEHPGPPPASPGSRTRDLAKRFENRMHKKSTLKSIQGAHLAHQHSSPASMTTSSRREEQQNDRYHQLSSTRSRSPSRHSVGDERSQGSSIGGRKSYSERSRYSSGDRPINEEARRSPANEDMGQRRRRPMQQPAPTGTSSTTTEREMMTERPASPKSDIPPSYMDRVEIETPSQARVRDLQEKLWDHGESLRASVHDRQRAQRNARSLSPRSRSLEERKVFKSRYYEAAAAAQRTTPNSPAGQSASTAGKTSRTSHDRRGDRSPHSYKSRESSSTNKARRSTTTAPRDEGRRTPVEQMESSSKPDADTDVNAAALLARLNAVDRSNPEAALAQIDAILKQGSISSSKDYSKRKAREEKRAAQQQEQQAASPEAQGAGPMDEEESSEGETDDETSVSSITNPTFPGNKAEKAHEAKASMPASGRPRPSSLQHYAATPHHKVSSGENAASPKHKGDMKEKAKRKSRRDKDRPPPPATIQVSSSKDRGNKEKAVASKDHRSDSEKRSTTPTKGKAQNLDWKMVSNRALSPADCGIISPVPDSMVEAVDKFLTPTPDQPDKEDGELVATNSAELAQKIRRWDEMSSPDSIPNVFSSESHGNTNPFEERKSTNPFDDRRGKTNPFEDRRSTNPFEDSTGRGTNPFEHGNSKNPFDRPTVTSPFDEEAAARDTTPNRNRRPHPWDSSMPVRSGRVDTRETSMDNAMGVEVEYSPRYGENRENYVDSGPPGRSQALSPRSMRKERISREMQSRGSSEGDEPPTRRHGDNFEVGPQLLKQKDSWEGGPSRFPRQQQELSKSLSDHYDEAWVAVPSSNYFPEKSRESREKRRQHARDNRDADTGPYRPPVRRDAPIQTIAPRTEQPKHATRRYVPPDPEKKYKPRMPLAYDEGPIDRPFDGKESKESDEQAGVEVALTDERTPEKARRKLRGLMKRRGTGKANTSGQSSVGSGSQPLKSQPLLGPYGMDLQASGGSNSDRGRRRSESKSPSRDRARSLDERRIRNPSIARKFSRLIRVYDEDRRAQKGQI